MTLKRKADNIFQDIDMATF